MNNNKYVFEFITNPFVVFTSVKFYHNHCSQKIIVHVTSSLANCHQTDADPIDRKKPIVYSLPKNM